MGNIIVAAIVVVLLIIGVLHYKKTLQSGCCGEHDQIKKIGTRDKDKNLYPYRTTLHIDDMFCKNCAATIENAFNQHKEYLASVRPAAGREPESHLLLQHDQPRHPLCE